MSVLPIKKDHEVLSAQNIDVNQLYRLLKESHPRFNDALFQAANSLAFPAQQVKTYQSDTARPLIELSCLGLVGVSSPLPHYFITDTLDDGNHPLRRFLGIFNQIIYHAYFRAWEQKNSHLFTSSSQHAQNLICALSSVDITSTDITGESAPFFMSRSRNHYGLKALLHVLYPGLSVDIYSEASDWIAVQSPSVLGLRGAQSNLSDNITLGKRLPVNARKCVVTLGPIRARDGLRYLPVSAHGKQLLNRVLSYINKTVLLDLIVSIDPVDCVHNLGQSMRLSSNSFLKGSNKIIIKKYKGM